MQHQYEPTIRNILEKKTLKWIFVGGKGGVGKTTTSSSLALLLAQTGRKVLIISTDPAHNLSDCYDQKFGNEAKPVKGTNNLWALQIEPKKEGLNDKMGIFEFLNKGEESNTMFQDLISSVPGIDEAIAFNELMTSIQKLSYDLIVFDTAPTGHTLRFLNFPNVLEKGVGKLLSLKQKFSNVIGGISNLMGSEQNGPNKFQQVFQNMEKLKESSKKVNARMKNPSLTTFVGVCISEFLSMYQTERLVQQLTQANIDIQNIVVNQVLFPESQCKMCNARCKMQNKYLSQIIELYDDFHVTIIPLGQNQVRGVQQLKQFGKQLLICRKPPLQFK